MGKTVLLRSQKQEPLRPSAVTLRSAGAAFVLLPLLAYWQIHMEIVRNSTHPSTLSLPFHAVFIILGVAGLNRLLRLFPRLQFLVMTQAELMFVYGTLTIGSAVCGYDMMQQIVPMLSFSFHTADAANGWGQNLNPLLPRGLFVSDLAVINPFYTGHASAFSPANAAAWLPVSLIWTGFISTLLWVMLCINAVIRRAWTEQEKLTYPIVQLPLQITDAGVWDGGTRNKEAGLFRQKLFWMGFLIAGSLDMINSLHLYFPAVPPVFTPGDGGSYFPIFGGKNPLIALTGAWASMDWTPVSFYPFVVGLGMLMPLDFLFSIFFFYWFWKLQKVFFVSLAYDQTTRFPYIENQAFGAYLSFCVLSVWVSRHYLRDVWKKAVGKPSPLNDKGEPMPYRVAVWGGLVGAALLVAFAAYLGVAWFVGVLFWIMYFALALAITRMRAELGTPIHDLHFTGPELILTRVGGTRAFDEHTLTGLGLLSSFNRAYRAHPMPNQLESFKAAEVTQSPLRSWTSGLMVFGVMAAFVGFWAYLILMYHYGQSARVQYPYKGEPFKTLSGWLHNPYVPGEPGEFWAIFVGFALAAALQGLRILLPWWPLHPLAYAVSSSWQVNLVWLPLTMAWVIKSVLLRFGGMRAFKNSLPFFFGLMLGQFVVGGLWNLWGTIYDVPTYRFWD